MARPYFLTKSSSPALSSLMNPSRVLTSVGMSYFTASVSGFSRLASRASTGLMTYFFILCASASVMSPMRMYIFAVRISGRSPCEIICMH